MKLHLEQIKAAEEVLLFLLNNNKEHLLTGGAGTGKTYVLNHILNQTFQEYRLTCNLVGVPQTYTNIHLTATTHAACEVLNKANTYGKAITIHSLLGIQLRDSWSDGREIAVLDSDEDQPKITNALIVVDECSAIDWQLRNWLLDNTINCKILYVGDMNQTKNITGKLSKINELPTSKLAVIKRTSHTVLKDLYAQLADNVTNPIFQTIKLFPGIIDFFTEDEVETFLQTTKDDFAIGTFTNNKCDAINVYCRSLFNLPEQYVIGEKLVISRAKKNSIIKTGSVVTILSEPKQGKHYYTDNDFFETHTYSVQTSLGDLSTITIASDSAFINRLLWFYAKCKDWKKYFELKKCCVFVKPTYAATCYKLQGSSVHTILIDLTDISSCTNSESIARMLYVGASRATQRIIFFGSLKSKYGKIV